MIYESFSSRQERRIKSWHRKFAFYPKTIGKTTVWFGYYWRRFKEVEVNSFHALEFAFVCALLGKRCGSWEYSVSEPVPRGTVIPFKRVS